MSLDASLRAKLLTLAHGAPVQQNYANEDDPEPRVWYQRQTGHTPMDLAGKQVWIRETTYAVEVNALDPDVGAAIAEAIAAEFPAGMNGFRGVIGDTLVLGCFVEDASDEYVPRGLDVDDGFHVFAFNLRIMY